jgi:DnaJ family protein A protein 5
VRGVEPFYRYWLSFVTVRKFACADKWDTRDAPDRRVKRLMEKENTKLRDVMRREYTQTVRVRYGPRAVFFFLFF